MTGARLLGRSAAAAIVLALVAPLPVSAVTNDAIRAKRAEADRARERLADCEDGLSEKVERYNAVSEALQETRRRIDDNRKDLARASRELAVAEARLHGRIDGMYREGAVNALEILLGTTSFEDFLTRLDLLARIGMQDVRLLEDVERAQARLERLRVALRSRETEQLALRTEAEAARREVEAAIRRQKAYVASLRADIARLVREEEERQRRLAEERARKAREEAARRAAAAAAAKKRAAANTLVMRIEQASTGEGHPEVVEIAMRYLGVPYRWGGTTPGGFDCSGLTQYVYRQVGVSLPRTSRSQFLCGVRIPASRPDLLQAGDLVFFGTEGDSSRIHHVGIYVGQGTFVHAPATGDVVRVTSLTERILSRRDYVGGSRL